jgi:hypothetical protein
MVDMVFGTAAAQNACPLVILCFANPPRIPSCLKMHLPCDFIIPDTPGAQSYGTLPPSFLQFVLFHPTLACYVVALTL